VCANFLQEGRQKRGDGRIEKKVRGKGKHE
jgi:hypothetical protein